MQEMGNALERAALWSAIGSVGAASASIAVSQILLGASLALLLVLLALRRTVLQLPSGWPLLAFFLGWTLLSWLVNGHIHEGLPQIKKFYVLLIVVVVATLLRGLRDARWVLRLWIALCALSSLWGFGQFWHKWHAAHDAGTNFYLAYVAARITGFNSHWMTFSQQLMLGLLAGVALILWDRATAVKWKRAVVVSVAVCAVAILLAMTRGVWFATGAALLYLLWAWRRWAVLALPVVAVAAFALGPQGLRERMISIVRPHGDTDSNMHRYVTFRTGLEMIKAHPLLGLGPEMPGIEFNRYVPPDIHRPLPDGFYGHLHNIYTQYAAERGIPAMLAIVGFLLWNLALWARALASLSRAASGGVNTNLQNCAWLLRAGIAMIIGILVTGMFDHDLGASVILTMTLGGVAAIDCAYREAQHA
jgi:putative inorganic carbon (HCO3(-)) transporter